MGGFSARFSPESDLVRQTEVSGLSVLPGGSCGVPPTNLFYSPRMPRLLRRFRREFDMIMIDSPPMIHLANARVLGRLADGVILVVGAGQTISESARFAIQRFAEDGTRVLPIRILRQVSGNADLVGGPTLAPQSASEMSLLVGGRLPGR